jgi:DNA topoisomerase VI B subunit
MAGKSAEELAKKQRQISIAEFFEKNRHLLGFDNPRKALLIAVKESVDNALDACEEARILPEINVELIQLEDTRFRMIIEDNGPGIVKAQIPKIFAKLLYGSKFHKLSSTRGQQGIGISATLLYGQLTTGRSALIKSKIGEGNVAHKIKLKINTQTNNPDIVSDTEVEWEEKDHGTRIEIDMEGKYQNGKQSVSEYLKETAIVNPHATIIYTDPNAEQIIFPRATEDLPKEVNEIKPHPYGIELGILIKMLGNTTAKTLQQFLTTEFVRVGAGTAKEICQNSSLLPNTKPKRINRDMAENLYKGIKKTKIISPPTNCISPIGSEELEKGLRKEINAEFYCSATRPPAVYRGNPFIIECCTGDSKLTLEDGTSKRIKDYVESVDNRKVMSMDKELKIVPTRVLAKQKFKNKHRLLRLKTKTGRELTLTANNEVPVIENGKIVWKKAEEVSSGEFLAVPKRYNIEGRIPQIIDLLNKKHVQILEVNMVRSLVEELAIKYGNIKSSAVHVGIPYERLKSFKRKWCISRPYLDELERIALDLNKNSSDFKKQIKTIRYVDNNFYNPKKIILPAINEDLLYILGLLDSDGYINKKTIAFVNLDESLHKSFKEKVETIFGINIKRCNNNSYFCNKTIYHILIELKKKLTSLPTSLIISWLKGFVDGDGWVNLSKKEIGIATARKGCAELVQMLLLRLGIVSTIRRVKIPKNFGTIEGRPIITKKEKYDISITSYSNVKQFRDLISFRQIKRAEKINKIDLSCTERDTSNVIPVGSILKRFREENGLFQYELGFSDTSIRQIEKGRQNITSNHLQSVMLKEGLQGTSFIQLMMLINSDILCDRIIDIEVMPNEEFVYDLTTENENFAANNIIMHNCALAYGGEQEGDKVVRVMRFANRVPLLYQQGACAISNSIQNTAWRNYGLQQSRSSFPVGPCTIVVHMTSVWVPFTSESKEALAHYPEIIKEIKLSLQEVGRKLASFVNKKKRIKDESKKRSYIEKYIPHVAEALQELLGIDEINKKKIEDNLCEILEHDRGELEEIKIDNPDYDEEFAKIGSEKAELSGTPRDQGSLVGREEKPVKEDKKPNEEPEKEEIKTDKESKQTKLA